jgi:tetrapyrrole methylase family protein/MazG family protein
MKEFDRLMAIMERLRAPGGCPWDAEQTHESIARCALEEAYELLDAISERNPEHIKEELGDMLLQVVFHAVMAGQAGDFRIEDVIKGISDKLVHRHPHVFGDAVANTAEDVKRSWEKLKKEEKGKKKRMHALDGVPNDLPSLLLAGKAISNLRKRGMISEDLSEHIKEIQRQLGILETCESPAEIIAEILFSVSAIAREMDIDTEAALRKNVLSKLAGKPFIEESFKGTGVKTINPWKEA